MTAQILMHILIYNACKINVYMELRVIRHGHAQDYRNKTLKKYINQLSLATLKNYYCFHTLFGIAFTNKNYFEKKHIAILL